MTYYIPKRICPWSSLRVSNGLPTVKSPEEESVGFMPVYDDLTKLLADWPGAEWVAMEEIKSADDSKDKGQAQRALPNVGQGAGEILDLSKRKASRVQQPHRGKRSRRS